jgi:cellulose synthase/poly-beta-1,6-N-acetylglucosamine synthase-like glycosyltransferase
MFLRFAIGDAQAGIFRPKVKYLILRYYVFLFLTFINRDVWYLAIPYLLWAIAKNYKYVKDIRAIFWLPILQLTADIMVIFGTIVGLLSRL